MSTLNNDASKPRICFRTLSSTIKFVGDFQSATSTACLIKPWVVRSRVVRVVVVPDFFFPEVSAGDLHGEIPSECDLHRKIPSSFPKEELQMAHIALPQINVSLSAARIPSLFGTAAWHW
jgi:hypothetical protein